MTWVILFAGIVVLCFAAALVLGLVGAGATGGLGSGSRSLSHEPLPEEPVADTDFDDLVFDVGLRGYRMSQVDGVVDRLRRELRDKDEEIAVLRGDPGDPDAPLDAKGLRDRDEPRDREEPRDLEEPRDPQELRDPQEPRDPQELRDPQEPRDPEDSAQSGSTVGHEPRS